MSTFEVTREHARLIPRGEEAGERVHESFSPEMQERRRARSNKPLIPRLVHFNREASKDAIRHFVEGIGDSNPLFTNEEYAKKSKYKQIVAPGAFLYSIQWLVPGRGGPGVHGWYSGGNWEWYRPILAGDTFTPVCVLRDLVEHQSKMTGSKTWHDWADVIYVNQRREIVGKELYWSILAERSGAGKARKYREIPKPEYSRDDWLRIIEAYENETKERRGSTPRFWEDVEVGEPLDQIIKGPLSVRDEVAWLMGAGSPFMRAHGIQFAWEGRHPRGLEYVPDTGDLDVPELVHFLDHFAKTIGIERAYDYGCQRQSWLCNLFTNWMGDDGFLWKMRGDMRVFNQIGDITYFNGKVTKKYVDGDKFCVDIEAWAKNQRDEPSMIPNPATVILPSREYGPVVYPNASPKLYKEVAEALPLDELLAHDAES